MHINSSLAQGNCSDTCIFKKRGQLGWARKGEGNQENVKQVVAALVNVSKQNVIVYEKGFTI